ncbi:serine O-acetyltransferase [Synechococcus sp. CS-1325]|uniref:serine O-acetyltransferase n=1 Tax=unclassified Synechococcus TaxID=2626047 RepID=UPI000DB88949|nr:MULTISPECIES: serine O-acetyltransferase [unclassified Synechococcus]PZV02306.1 MAG: serine O-acetyltransferase [Cyanobium sp.]MCT0199215.1 serine O-acetyltransferase [Synechococcus sp. CS-1325]MCT0214606.1 serine O-acetyltransferase [Synechococcus sp. CS-1326]MCT0231077.1 serine O-acetyltransferase [Synechococcus sp. CS-1324]MCT0233940.1 serine O-acetyltransferase [Synechococcus sp. CS-1327]
MGSSFRHLLSTVAADLRIIKERDPAARSTLEILLCYPGFHALVLHRFSHRLWRCRIPLLPRLLSQLGRSLTGVEIHPGARIGSGVFIDHGMGVVIGETAEIGNRCLLYQGVTLGGTGKVHGKRHPTLGENVVVGAGANVLGAITVGSNTRIGAGSVLLRDVQPDSTVVGIPGRVVHQSGVRIDPLAHSALPDAEARVIRNLMERIDVLENDLSQLQHCLRDVAAGRPLLEGCGAKAQNLKDREILEFLGDRSSING